MATAYKVLGQLKPTAATLSSLYTVPTDKQAVCSTLCICNQGPATYIRVAVRPAGATIDDKHYIVKDRTIDPGETLFLTLGLTLAATDVVSVYAYYATVSFNLFGQEIS